MGKPQYLGKLVGAIAGLVTGKWPLVLLGVLLGHQFDRGFSARRQKALPREFIRVAFTSMGHLAKADGRVSEDEIRLARTTMHALNLDGAQTREAMDWFNAGKHNDFALAAELELLAKRVGADKVNGRRLVELLLPVLLIKDKASADERRVLWQVCQRFDISRVELAQMEAAARMQHRFARGGAPNASKDRAQQAFDELGLAPDASDTQIKNAYRRLISRAHPDKLSGSGVSQQEIAAASRKTREIREAYELLRERRGFR